MKFKLGLAMTLCIALGTANVVAFADESGFATKVPASVVATEIPATETPAVVTPTEATPAEATPAEATPATETPAEVTPAVVTPAVVTPAVETPAEVTPAVETPAEVTPAVVTPAEEAPAEVTPAVETPAEVTPAVETPAEVTPAEELIEIPDEEIPLAEIPLVEEVPQATTLKVIHKVHGLFETTETEEVITGLVAGQSIQTTAYAHHEDILEVSSESEEVVLASGENEIVIDYLLLREAIDPSRFVEIDETSFQNVEEVSAE